MEFWDTEHGIIITEHDLRNEFENLKANGETDAKCFAEYRENCTGKNGTLEIIK